MYMIISRSGGRTAAAAAAAAAAECLCACCRRPPAGWLAGLGSPVVVNLRSMRSAGDLPARRYMAACGLDELRSQTGGRDGDDFVFRNAGISSE